jgi:hypothetical protein
MMVLFQKYLYLSSINNYLKNKRKRRRNLVINNKEVVKRILIFKCKMNINKAKIPSIKETQVYFK